MQKPKNLLPGLFLCVFSRTAEPLVDFYCSNLLVFPLFLFGADFFCWKERGFRPFYTAPFYTGHFCTPILQKTPRTPRLYSAALFGMPPPQKAPALARPEPLKKRPFWGPVPQTLLCLRTQKAPRTPRLYSAALFGTHRPPKGSTQKPGERASAPQKFPNAKNPGNKSRGLVDEKFI